MIALILAGGFAKRMGALTANCPKPLLEVAGRSIVDYIIDKIEECPDVSEIIISTNARFRENFNKWLSNARHHVNTRIVHEETKSEDEKLGAVGALAWLIEHEKLAGDLMVVNGDNLFKFNLQKFIELFDKTKGPVLGVYDVREMEEAKKMGVVALDADSHICDFQEKPEAPKSTLVSTGIYIFPAGSLGLFRQYLDEGNDKDKIGSFIAWLYKKYKVAGHVFMEDWFDIGSVDTYEMVKKRYMVQPQADRPPEQAAAPAIQPAAQLEVVPAVIPAQAAGPAPAQIVSVQVTAPEPAPQPEPVAVAPNPEPQAAPTPETQPPAPATEPQQALKQNAENGQ